MLPGKRYTLDDAVRVLLRRKWLVILPTALGIAAAVPIAQRIPRLYRSETLIMVVPQRVPDSYVKATVTTKVEDRLPSINEQILSRSRLERIIVDFGLYSDARAMGLMEDVVERMRRDITVTLEGKDSFRVSFASTDGKTAQQVTERLASLYIEENLRDRQNLAENTNEFLESQLEEAKARLVQHEKKLEDYRRRYAGQLPTQLQSNLQVIQNAQLQLQTVNESMNRAHERRLLLERQIADARMVTTPSATDGNGTAEPVAVSASEQLKAAQRRLEVYRLRYMADHPDIRTLEHTIRELQARVDAEARQAPDASRILSPEEAAQQKRLRDLQAEVDVVDHQLAALQQEELRLKRTMADYQGKIDVVPTRESELVELTRDYGTLQQSYADLLGKREESKMAANLERRQIGEQFRILDPASLPERPYNGVRRNALSAMSVLAGLFLGLGLVAFTEYRDDTFKCEADVLRVLELPVLTVIPRMFGDAGRRTWRRLLLGTGGFVLVCGAIVAALVLARLRW